MFVKYYFDQSKVYLYKHSPGGGTPTPDITPPSTPTNLSATAVSSSQINLSWNPSTDNIGVTGYRIYRNGTQIATTASITYQDTGLTPSTTYTYTVAAYDVAGNISPQSSPASATTQASSDITPPTVSLSFPASGSTVSGAITISATASDNVGVAGVQFKLNGASLGAEDTSTPYSILWDTTLAADGAHTLTAVARDAAGNTQTSASVTVTVNNTVSTGPSDFQTRCSQAGVIKCVGFDVASDIAGSWGSNHGVFPANPASGGIFPTLDPVVKTSGASALKFTIPSNSDANSSGSYFTNFSDDLLTQFGEGEEFYVQWRQRFSPEFLNTYYTGGGGWKQDIIGEGDRAGVCNPSAPTSATCPTSCSQLEIVAQNSSQLGIPQMYHSCGGKDGSYEGIYMSDPAQPGSLYLQVGCPYSGGGGPSTYPEPPCDRYKSDQWMTFQVRVKIGTWYKNDRVYHKDSAIQLWVADEGQPSKLVIDRDPAKGTGYDIANTASYPAKYGKIWFLPYHTGKDPTQVHPTAYTWYDELIISRNKIADPSTSGTPTTLLGDLNNDRTVNGLDWSIMESRWFSADVTADINKDGVVNSIDFSLMNQNWGRIQ